MNLEDIAGSFLNFLKLRKTIDDQFFKIIIAFIPGLLSISYPLIVQTISKLNDEYKSTHIVDNFRKERIHKWFFISLLISVALTLLCLTKFQIVTIFALISVINLLAAFFSNIVLLLTYQSGKALFERYSLRLDIGNHSKYFTSSTTVQKLEVLFKKTTTIQDGVANPLKKTRRFIGRLIIRPIIARLGIRSQRIINAKKYQLLSMWHPMVDLYTYSIIKHDRKLQEDCKTFIRHAFEFIKQTQIDQDVVQFPIEFYNSTYDILSTFIKNKDDNYYQSLEFLAGPVFFSDSYNNKKQFLHQQSYMAIWRNLTLLIESERDDKIQEYWGAAHQYCRFKLGLLNIEYDENHNESSESHDLRIKISNHRQSFIEFHTVLGAYLMHKKKYSTLREIWFFTQSQPPQYVLLPQTMNDIFSCFFKFNNFGPIGTNFIFRYYFKNLIFDAMNNRPDVQSTVRRYACLLFLKQWITPPYYGQSNLVVPQIPESQAEKFFWETNLPLFKSTTKALLSEIEIMKEMNLEKITKSNCADKEIPYPLDLIDELDNELRDGYKNRLLELELDTEIVTRMDNSTVSIIQQAYNDFSRIRGTDVQPHERDETSNNMQVIRGTKLLLNKEVFVTDTSTSYHGFESLAGNSIKYEYYNHIATKFHANTTIRYEIPNGSMFNAVDKLNLTPSEHCIIAFNINVPYIGRSSGINFVTVVDDSEYRYNEINIYCFKNDLPFINKVIFVIRKIDLPMIKHKNWDQIVDLDDTAREYWQSLTLINRDLSIYRKITELNADLALLEEYEQHGEKNRDQLQNMVEIDVDFLGYCWFKKDTKLVSIKESKIFQEGGTKNSLDDIVPFV